MMENEVVLSQFKLGKRENSFYIKSDYPPVDRFGMQSNNSKGYYIYDWDAEKHRHVQKWIEKE